MLNQKQHSSMYFAPKWHARIVSWDINTVYRYVILVYSITLTGEPLMTNFVQLQSQDRGGILFGKPGPDDICHFNNRTFYLAYTNFCGIKSFLQTM